MQGRKWFGKIKQLFPKKIKLKRQTPKYLFLCKKKLLK